ncbi:membrane-bound lytic murein transglycosylase MltC [Thaumasiovibrio subtropicus]|uniref:membrane-bound lytic murein transglycosylase MltC n=1 Tax=Thaumasiovibrio subtropicus TaxID=1891207 RepID=UPI000B35CD96|nr:membrane-bound lytic murein transglycosylase MltC [Thaumasiovibrio subtropicus]
MIKALSIIAFLLLAGCSREFIESIYEVDYTTTNRFATNLAPLPGQFEKDIAALDSLIGQFTGQVKRHWGDDVLMAGKRDYVKYTDNYLSRAHVDFTRGVITISTVAKTDRSAHLKQAIVTTLLTPDDPAGVDLYSAAEVTLKGKPFLFEQVLDHEGKAIAWEWRANRFADHLIANNLQQGKILFQNSLYVEIPMVANHADMRGYKYASIVRQASQKYGIAEDLIYAIIKTESSFNPYAVSWANAYGLMQIVPKTAGVDVYRLVKNKPGQPSPEQLFDPAYNIDMGTAYFYLLKHRYLKDVEDPLTLHYAMISAYNGGTGNVLRTFHTNRDQAMRNINQLQPNQVYWALTNRHPLAESKRYLEKVTHFQREFNQGKI